jgi:hypothetical protein
MMINVNEKNAKFKRILSLYRTVFGDADLKDRLADIQDEAIELMLNTGEENLREELGDLICSCLALVAEKDWDLDELIEENLAKVKKRFRDGRYTKEEEKK